MKSKILALSKNEEFRKLLQQKKVSNKYVTIFFGYLNDKNKKSAILALFQASLDQANQGEIEINQNSHFQKIMVRSKNG